VQPSPEAFQAAGSWAACRPAVSGSRARWARLEDVEKVLTDRTAVSASTHEKCGNPVACRGQLSVRLDGVLVGHVGYRADGAGDADVPVSGVHKGSRVVITARGGDRAGLGNTATRAYRIRR